MKIQRAYTQKVAYRAPEDYMEMKIQRAHTHEKRVYTQEVAYSALEDQRVYTDGKRT